MRLLATVLTVAAMASMLLLGQTSAASAKQEKCGATKNGIEYYRGKTWAWEKKLGFSSTPASANLQGRLLRKSNACAYLEWVRQLWKDRANQRSDTFGLLSKSAEQLSTEALYFAAEWEVNNGGIYSHAWGAASPRFKELCYEAINREFGANAPWARYVVNRESGCNIAAINFTYSDPGERATGLSQMIPNVHTWVDYRRVMHDLKYSVAVFKKLATDDRGNLNTQPWCLCG